MRNYDESVEINHNPSWSYICDHPYRILISGGSGSSKTNVLLNLVKYQGPDIDKIYLCVKDPFKSKYQLLLNWREKVGIKKLKNPKALTEHSQTIDVYENLEDYNPRYKREGLIVFDDTIADMEANKQLHSIVTELFLRGRKLNISLVFISQPHFKVLKTIRLKCITLFCNENN